MGQRASYAVIDGGSIGIYYSHWGAPSIPDHLLAGPDGMLAYIRSLVTSDKLLDDVWAEGAVLLNRDRRQLLFWGGDDISVAPHLRRGLLPVLRALWPGWSVEWATYGIVDVARGIGVDPSVVLASDLGGDLLYPTTADKLHEEHPEYQSVAVTMRDTDGRVTDHLFSYGHPVSAGPALLEVCRTRPSITLPREDTGFAAFDGPAYIDEGAYVDVVERAIWIWLSETVDPRQVEDAARRWPGWQVYGHSEGLARQVALSGRDPRAVMAPDLEIMRQLIDILSISRAFDPTGLLRQALSDPPPREGITAVVHAHFLNADPEGMAPDERRRLLEKGAGRVLPLLLPWASSDE